MTIVLLLAMFYKQYGEVPLIESIFTGIIKFKVNSSYLIIMGGFIGWLVTTF